MEQLLNEIRFHYTDEEINTLIKKHEGSSVDYTLHYDQNENFFIQLKQDFTVPHLPIHHDVRVSVPSDNYLDTVRQFLISLIPRVPQLFHGMTYFFDPAEVLRPSFFQIFKNQDSYFLYLLRLDLIFRTHEGTILERGTNDTTPEYSTSHLFLERDLIPLEKINIQDGKIRTFVVQQTISQTWIGETGRGYFVQGIWMDSELTKFFSKLFTPRGKRTYPYYPFTCKYRTICHSLLLLNPDGRKQHLKRLVQAMNFIIPSMEEIQEALKSSEFSENLECFQVLKTRVAPELEDFWNSLSVKPYLNTNDMKEYALEF